MNLVILYSRCIHLQDVSPTFRAGETADSNITEPGNLDDLKLDRIAIYMHYTTLDSLCKGHMM
jgi:hypothetical protein